MIRSYNFPLFSKFQIGEPRKGLKNGYVGKMEGEIKVNFIPSDTVHILGGLASIQFRQRATRRHDDTTTRRLALE